MDFFISVIIPVYNGEKFIVKAVESVLIQPEVIEIIIIDDASTDNTLHLIKQLEKEQNRIVVLKHSKNLGRASTRNTGIRHANSEFIAFLDADDFYLPNRFKTDKELFKDHQDIDGIYNAIGTHFYRNTTRDEQKKLELTTLNKTVDPDSLFNVLFKGKHGHFSIDGLTIKRHVFKIIGFFNEEIPVAEDTELIYRLAIKLKLHGGVLHKPVAMRGVHEDNVFNKSSIYKKHETKMYMALLSWCTRHYKANEILDLILNRIWIMRYKTDANIMAHINYWLAYTLGNPKLLFTTLSIKYFPLIRLRQKLFPFLYNNSK
ncbi:MAG: glycosyltransferase family 2 protein [Bacteroidia bacterium]|nr:glycosyltransferase family 2 protein [Winogradskyella sp.]MBT8375879.1 glycosyltransferase family 2 protein [Bacteroidia bacterium]